MTLINPETNKEEFNAGIEELKACILTMAYHNAKDDFVCEECIQSIHKLLGILTRITGKEDKEFAKEIYEIIGE